VSGKKQHKTTVEERERASREVVQSYIATTALYDSSEDQNTAGNNQGKDMLSHAYPSWFLM
jgi:hypothetical protein